MTLLYLAVGWIVIVALYSLISEIARRISKHKDNNEELEKIIKDLTSKKVGNIQEKEKKITSLKQQKILERPSKKKIKKCQSLLSPYIVEFSQNYSKKIVLLKESVDRQDIVGAEKILKEIHREQYRAPQCCKQYDKSISSYYAKLEKIKLIQNEFNDGIQRLQLLLENGTRTGTSDIVQKLHSLMANNPTYRKFDKQLLHQLESEIELKWPKWEKSNDFFDFLDYYSE